MDATKWVTEIQIVCTNATIEFVGVGSDQVGFGLGENLDLNQLNIFRLGWIEFEKILVNLNRTNPIIFGSAHSIMLLI